MADPPSQRARHQPRLAFAPRAWRVHLCWLLGSVAAGCHMVGYGTEPLTTVDAGEPISAADGDVTSADAQATPEASLPPHDGGAATADASELVERVPEAAAGTRPDTPAPAVRPVRDASAERDAQADDREPRSEACRGPGPCNLTCSRSSDPSCSARCIDAPVCALACTGPSAGPGPAVGQGPGACQLSCDRVDTCTPACAPGSRCAIRCRDTRECFVGCEGGSTCDVACEGSTCAVNCAPGAACLLRCAPGTACGFWECRMGERLCADGVRACGTRCPEER